eukprot:gene10062-12334_t
MVPPIPNKKSTFKNKPQQQQQKPKTETTNTTTTTTSSNKKNEIPKEILEQKCALPVYSAREPLLKHIKDNKTVIIVSETGTGKTTQIPQYLYESGYTDKGGCIAITQPRKVAAVSISKRVSIEMGVEMGKEVGYHVRFDDKTTNGQTKLKYMTDGMLVREAMVDPLLSKYSVIMLDEAHERTLNTDVLFGLLKSIQLRRLKKAGTATHQLEELKIIIMSATLDADMFSEYFDKAPVLYIEGRQFPVQIYYTEELQKDYTDAALVTVLQIHLQSIGDSELARLEEEEGGDILVFLTGREEIDNLEKLLLDRIPRLPPDAKQLLVCPIYAAMPQEQQMKVFEKAPKGARKVVIATNIAETSLTINGIRYVVDTGVVKSKIYNPKIGIDSLTVIPISQASAKQRSGRAGREFEGKCYRLYTCETFKNMENSSIPEIKRSNIANVILQLKTIGIHDILAFDFLERPPIPTVKKSLELLYCLDALDDSGNLTPLGKKMALFPLDPMYSKTLIKSMEFECVEEILIIISMLSVESIFFAPRDKQNEVDAVKKIFFSPEGDHITLLNNVFEQLVKYCTSIKMKIQSCMNDFERVRKCFITGFYMNVAVLQPDKKYKTMSDNKEIFIHPTSFLFEVKPQYILYNELTITSKPFARNVLPIEPSWLPEICPKFYGSKKNSTDQSEATITDSIEKTTKAFSTK